MSPLWASGIVRVVPTAWLAPGALRHLPAARLRLRAEPLGHPGVEPVVVRGALVGQRVLLDRPSERADQRLQPFAPVKAARADAEQRGRRDARHVVYGIEVRERTRHSLTSLGRGAQVVVDLLDRILGAALARLHQAVEQEASRLHGGEV